MQNSTLSIEERNEMLQVYSDFHKDAYGFRPRWNYHSLSDAELIADFDTFSSVCKENAIQEDIQLQADLKAWDELIDKTIHLGAKDYKTALRWIVEGHNEWDAEHIVWSHGILFSDKGRQVVEDIHEVCSDILGRVFEGA